VTFLSPRQLGAMDNSDDELQLMTEVAVLDARLKKADCTCDESMYSHRFENFKDQPLANRLKLWRFRKQLREKLVAEMLPLSAASGETATAAPAVIKEEIKQERDNKRKFEEPARVHGNVSKSKPTFSYKPHQDDSAPVMSPLHVAFAKQSVEQLRKRPKMTGPELIQHWNSLYADGSITVEIPRSCKGHQA
jgi:hypothetical protein